MQDRPAPIQDDATAPPHARGALWERRRYLSFERNGVTTLIALTREITHIGSGLSVDVHLDDKSVSRRHALIVATPRGTLLLDDRSATGTWVNACRVTQATLRDGDVLALGDVVARYIERHLPGEWRLRRRGASSRGPAEAARRAPSAPAA